VYKRQDEMVATQVQGRKLAWRWAAITGAVRRVHAVIDTVTSTVERAGQRAAPTSQEPLPA
jgi:hypothetical protein